MTAKEVILPTMIEKLYLTVYNVSFQTTTYPNIAIERQNIPINTLF